MKIYFKNNPKLTVGHIITFINDLCPADYEELIYSHGSKEKAVNAFLAFLPTMDIYTMHRKSDHKILAMGGLSQQKPALRYGVWLLCTGDAFKYPTSLYRYCHKILSENNGIFDAFVYKPNKRHIAFVTKGMGFKPLGIEKGKLALYSKEGELCAM